MSAVFASVLLFVVALSVSEGLSGEGVLPGVSPGVSGLSESEPGVSPGLSGSVPGSSPGFIRFARAIGVRSRCITRVIGAVGVG